MRRQLDILLKVLMAIAIVIILNITVSHIYFRIDLTSEKRYTLSDVSKQNLENLTDSVYIKIFLHGDLPVSFVRMKKEVNDMLDEFAVYANNKIQYEFIDPNSGNTKTQEQTQQFLASHGIIPYTIQEKNDDGKLTQRLLFPGAIASNGKKAVSFNLLKNTLGKSSDEAIHNSIQNLEYELLNGIKRLTIVEKPKIAFLTGHGELAPKYVVDISMALAEYYTVERIDLNRKQLAQDEFSTLIIAKPRKNFSEADKYAIDQFIMHGGNVLWLLDMVLANKDSLAYASSIMALANPLNLQDQLFKYGIRVNFNLALDNQCLTIPVNVASVGAPPQFNPAPWYYAPLMRPSANSIITKNVTSVCSDFVSVLDTVSSSSAVQKTVLLTSSKYAKVLSLPVPVSFDILNQRPDEQFFNSYDLIFGVLMEGHFQSVFENRDVGKYIGASGVPFKGESSYAKQVVIADGDVIKNDVRTRGLDTIPFPLGYDKFTKQTFGNKDLILNIVNYMNGGEDILQLRSRELQIRMLNKNRINEEKVLWQIVNVALPLLFIILFGLGYSIFRRRKYTIR